MVNINIKQNTTVWFEVCCDNKTYHISADFICDFILYLIENVADPSILIWKMISQEIMIEVLYLCESNGVAVVDCASGVLQE